MSTALAQLALPASLGVLVCLAAYRRLARLPRGARTRALEPIVLFTADTPNGKKISILLEELGLAYRVVSISLDLKEQHTPGFLRHSPNNKIPAIIDPNVTDPRTHEPLSLFESGAIMLYLARQYGSAELRGGPHATDEHACVQWLFFQAAGLGPAPGQVHHFVGKAGLADAPPSAEPLPAAPNAEYAYALARFDQETRRLYGVLDRRLAATGAYVVGEHMSIADIALWCWAWRAPRHKVDLRAYPAVRAWFERIEARPAVQRGLRVPTAEHMRRPRVEPVPELEPSPPGAQRPRL